jgi:hypothetical protein
MASIPEWATKTLASERGERFNPNSFPFTNANTFKIKN